MVGCVKNSGEQNTKLSGLQNTTSKVLRLDNEVCIPRPTLVNVGGENDFFYPRVISLHRCGGACIDGTVTRACGITSSTQVHVHVLNLFTNTNETVAFTNHTACRCSCVHDASVCTSTQTWNESTCACACKQQAENSTTSCGENFQWNPRLCRCECDLMCTHKKKYVNESSCSCQCKERVYQKCSRRGFV